MSYCGSLEHVFMDIAYFIHISALIDPSHKSHNALDKYPTMHQFVTEMCTHVHIPVTKWCIVGYVTGALWDLYNSTYSHQHLFTPSSLTTRLISCASPQLPSDHCTFPVAENGDLPPVTDKLVRHASVPGYLMPGMSFISSYIHILSPSSLYLGVIMF